jgi:hypothetical protein
VNGKVGEAGCRGRGVGAVRSGMGNCRTGCLGRRSGRVRSCNRECDREGGGRVGRLVPFGLAWGQSGAVSGGSAGSGTGRVSAECGWCGGSLPGWRRVSLVYGGGGCLGWCSAWMASAEAASSCGVVWLAAGPEGGQTEGDDGEGGMLEGPGIVSGRGAGGLFGV